MKKAILFSEKFVVVFNICKSFPTKANGAANIPGPIGCFGTYCVPLK